MSSTQDIGHRSSPRWKTTQATIQVCKALVTCLVASTCEPYGQHPRSRVIPGHSVETVGPYSRHYTRAYILRLKPREDSNVKDSHRQ